MHYITLDTNTWIYIANGTEPVKILHFIKDEIEKNNIKILLPKTIVDEWNIHKEKTVKIGTLKHFNDIKDSLERIKKLIGEEGKPDSFNFLFEQNTDKESFNDFIKSFKNKRQDVENAVNNNIQIIEKLFQHKNTIVIEISDKVKIKAGQFAIEKKAPFKNKNSFADALIVFSFIDYIAENKISDAFFITYNTDAFCEKKEKKKELHPDLEPDFKATNSKFYTIVGEAINTIEHDIVTQEELEFIREQQLEIETYEIEYCIVCSEMSNRNNEVWFGKELPLLDQRKILMYDPDQLEFGFSKNLPKSKFVKKINNIEIGHCEWCNTLHFRCIECGTINAIWEDEYNKIKECEGCGLEYQTVLDKDPHNHHEVESFVLPKKTDNCIICGDEYEIKDLKDKICRFCKKNKLS